MKGIIRPLKRRLKGTWIHHAVWSYRNPAPRASDNSPSAKNERYNWQTVQVMFRVLRPNSNCIDVGAHVGEILYHMTEIAPRGKHHAFEPLAHMCRVLRRDFPHVTIHQTALSDQSGESEFLFVENDPGYSGLRPRRYNRPDPQITKLRVQVAKLDEVISSREKIGLIKLDIEGGEIHAMKGGIETIHRGRPVILFEGGSYSTAHYGVTPQEAYRFIDEVLAYDLSTMERWLNRRPPYTQEEWRHNWENGPDSFFIATPRREARR